MATKMMKCVCGAAVLAALTAGAVETVTVQARPRYNSWPMIAEMKGLLVCGYSRGAEHTIHPGERGTFARVSRDGGRTWEGETKIVNDPTLGEVTIGKGNDADGAALFWIRCMGRRNHHDLYRTTDGKTFEKIAVPKLDPWPMQITDVVSVPGVGLMSLWFTGLYSDDVGKNAWGTLTSTDNGRTWTQRIVEKNLKIADQPTEQSFVVLGEGRLLAIARTERGGAQFQLESRDNGATWTRTRTNITDVSASTPSLILDAATGTLYNYYYDRKRGNLNRRVAKVDDVWGQPLAWPAPELLAHSDPERPYDAGNANAVVYKDTHVVAWYSGTSRDADVFVTLLPAPVKK